MTCPHQANNCVYDLFSVSHYNSWRAPICSALYVFFLACGRDIQLVFLKQLHDVDVKCLTCLRPILFSAVTYNNVVKVITRARLR